MEFDSATFRKVLGHYPTGVCAITAMTGEGPVGMVVGTFNSVSLDPPLVGFYPDRGSTTWPRIATAGLFCVNVLSERQQDVCRAMASKAPDKFNRIAHRLSGMGSPIIEGAVAWIDCGVHAVHAAGDHFIVLGKVYALGIERANAPLLFFQGGYGMFASAPHEAAAAV